ncbi:MAG: CusA/CzcA family heavy metal efflux RND transporter [Pedobacter sp.]|nr:MAG: CusA/CzcA family heavy metal efflux RND transporter [Pedobacter sp.]
MLNKIIEFAIHNKLMIGLFILGLIGYGSYQFTKLPIDAVPDITNNQVQVITTAPSFGATDIERLVTFPIEQANSNIAGLEEIRSFSRFGLSLVTLVFDEDTDIYWARQQVAERLQKVQTEIPEGIGFPELGPITTGLGEIYQYVLRPAKGYEQKYDITELRTLQDWVVRRQLLGVKGVAEVSSFGGKLKQFSIEIDPDKLLAHQVHIDDIFKALAANNQNTGGSYIEKGPTVLYIRAEGLVGNLDEIGHIRIKSMEDGSPLFIRDVADVKIGHATRYGAMTYNDEGEVAGAVVMMLKGANSSEVIKNVKERVVQIQKTLPEGVIIEAFLDRSKMVNNAIGTVRNNLMEGALIVVFVLVLFLGNFRAGLIVASIIPLAMLFAVIMMNLFGVSGNLMSLGALDFGLIVDGAVIIVEAVLHYMHDPDAELPVSENRAEASRGLLSQSQMDKIVGISAGKMMNSAVFGQIIILVVYLPIFALEGIEGKMFKPMAQTVAFALLGAFILSLTYVPMMSALFLSKKTKYKPNISDRMMGFLESKHQKYLTRALRIPKWVLGVTLGLFAIAMVILSRMGGEFIPSLEEGDFAVETRVLTGSSLNTTIEQTQKTSHILVSRFPEVEKVVTKIGNSEVPMDPMPMEASDMVVILKPKSEWTTVKTFPEMADTMSRALSEIPGVSVGFQFPVQMRFNELMTGARQDVVLKIFGEDLDSLSKYADKLGQLVKKVDGAKDLYVETVSGLPQILISYNRAALAEYQVAIEDVNRVVNMSLAGQSSGKVFEGERRFDLVVRLNDQKKNDLAVIKNLLIPTPTGQQIPLAQLADVSIKDGPNQIQREDAKRRIIVGFNVQGRDVQSIVQELQAKVESGVKLPTGYYVTYGGAFENLNAAKDRLLIAVPISLLLIFLLLFFAFKSIKHGLLIYSAIPLSAIGGIFFLALRDMPFSISAGIGFIALFGVAVLNGIVLVAEFNRLKKAGLDDVYEIVLQGTKIRLRPVLMTAFVASLGFLPMALSNGAGAEVQRPLATVVIGGLLIATFLTLFVLPVLYITFEKIAIKKMNKNTKMSGLTFGILACLIFSTRNVQGQVNVRPIKLQEALEMAQERNHLLKSEMLKAQYQQDMIGTAVQLPALALNSEFGQINSAFVDKRLEISQGFQFPTIYKHQKELFTKDWEKAVLELNVEKQRLASRVKTMYYSLGAVQERVSLLKSADSLFRIFLTKTESRLAAGESTILEKAAAQAQLVQIKTQLQTAQQEYQTLLFGFQLLLNSPDLVAPVSLEIIPWKESYLSPPPFEAHPLVQGTLLDQDRARIQLAIEKAKLLPEINLGYVRGTFKGEGPDGIQYKSSDWFQAGQVGISLPIFASGQKAKIKAAKTAQLEAQNSYAYQVASLKNAYLTLAKNTKMKWENLESLKPLTWSNADTIEKTAFIQFQAGAINYLDFILLINQAFQLKEQWIENKKSYAENIIQLDYLYHYEF